MHETFWLMCGAFFLAYLLPMGLWSSRSKNESRQLLLRDFETAVKVSDVSWSCAFSLSFRSD